MRSHRTRTARIADNIDGGSLGQLTTEYATVVHLLQQLSIKEQSIILAGRCEPSGYLLGWGTLLINYNIKVVLANCV